MNWLLFESFYIYNKEISYLFVLQIKSSNLSPICYQGRGMRKCHFGTVFIASGHFNPVLEINESLVFYYLLVQFLKVPVYMVFFLFINLILISIYYTFTVYGNCEHNNPLYLIWSS